MKYFLSNLLIISMAYPLALFGKAVNLEIEEQKHQITEKAEKKNNNFDELDQNKEEHVGESAQTAGANEKQYNSIHKSNETEGKQTQKGAQEAEKTVKIGNLVFPSSQQPSPLVSFGQNIINKKQAQAQLSINEFKGKKQYFININPAIIYAFTDSLSLFLVASFAPRYRQGNHHSSGPEDTTIQGEYAFYTKAYKTFYDQATIVANVTIPTGSTTKNPPTGVGANSFFLGRTYSRMEINWFYFVSSGGILMTSSHQTKHGNQFLYQFGFGRRIANTSEWLFDWMIEVNGTFSWKDKINGKIDPNSGGNVIYLTPSLWISTNESLFLQFGIGFPIQQSLFGNQKKNEYALFFNSGWLF
jgi:hypothetical protein